jgi:uncharacterized membrane protein
MWLFFTTLAYFFIALQVVLDKFLLSSRRVSHPSLYAFYSGLLSLFVLAFLPWGFHTVDWREGTLALVSGAIFVYGMLAMFYALETNEASRVAPVAGAVVPVVTYFLSLFFLKEQLNFVHLFGVALLILGGLFISLELRHKKLFPGFWPSLLSGIFLGIAFAIFKILYDWQGESFLNVFIWTRFGLVLGGVSLLLYSDWRKKILGSFVGFHRNRSAHASTSVLFVLVKTIGGGGSILLNRGIALGSVTIVNALVSLEYAFIFLLGLLFSFWLPRYFKEKWHWENIIQKVLSLIIISLGVVLVAAYK